MENKTHGKNPHYFSEEQDGVFEKKEIKAKLLGNEFVFKTGPGVFSKERVDRGTEILVENCIVKKAWKVLDLGSGIGVVGIAVAKKYKCEVVMTEINKRAHLLSKENITLNKVENIKALQGDMFEKLDKYEIADFDAVLLNPPQTAGKKICLSMIDGSFERLKKKGLLQMVARHNKGGKTLSEYMRDLFGNVKEIAKESGYRVYVSEK